MVYVCTSDNQSEFVSNFYVWCLSSCSNRRRCRQKRMTTSSNIGSTLAFHVSCENKKEITRIVSLIFISIYLLFGGNFLFVLSFILFTIAYFTFHFIKTTELTKGKSVFRVCFVNQNVHKVIRLRREIKWKWITSKTKTRTIIHFDYLFFKAVYFTNWLMFCSAFFAPKLSYNDVHKCDKG